MFRKHGFEVNIKTIENVIKNPKHLDKESDFPNIIASRTFDQKHILRVVFRKEHDIIKIITFYPAEKGRYY